MIHEFTEVSDDAKPLGELDPELAEDEMDPELVSDLAWSAAVAPGETDEFDELAVLAMLAVEQLLESPVPAPGNQEPWRCEDIGIW